METVGKDGCKDSDSSLREPLLAHKEDNESLELKPIPVESLSCVQKEPLLSDETDVDSVELRPIKSPEHPQDSAVDNIGTSPRTSNDAISEHPGDNRNGASTPNDELDGPENIDLTELHRAAAKGDLVNVKKVFSRLRSQINAHDADGYSPLHLAAKSGKRDVIDFLIQNGATVNRCCENQITPLHAAIINNNFDVAKCLIENGASVLDQDNNGFTSLHFAAANDFHEILQYMLDTKGVLCVFFVQGHEQSTRETVDTIVNAMDNAKKTPLHHAVSCGSRKATQLLLDKNADIKAADSDGDTVLHIAATENYPDLIELIIEKVIQGEEHIENFVNQQNAHQFTAFELASLRGNIEAANVLMRIKEVKTTFTNEAGTTTIDMKMMYPLHRASANGEDPVIQYFIERQVPIDIKDIDGFTPLMEAVYYGQENVVNYLIENGANIQLRDFNLKTCLHIAVEQERTSILRLLLDHCKEYLINDRDMDYMTPLHYAAKDGNVEALKVLLERASFIAVDHKGKSPLHFAAESGSLECVTLLKEAQLDIDLHADDGETSAPICLAAKESRTDVCKYLIENGAKIKSLLSAKHDIFVNIFEQLIESTTINPQEEDSEEMTRPRFISVRREIDCLQTLLALIRKSRTNDWINKTIASLKEEVCAVFDEYEQRKGMTTQRGNKLVEMLVEDIANNDGESEKVVMGKLIQEAPDVAEYALDKSVESFEGETRKRYKFGILDIKHTSEAVIDEPFFGPDTMNRYNRRQLLAHPVTLRLMKCKWVQLGLIMYLISILVYMIFLALVTSMVITDKQKEQNLTDPDGKGQYHPTSRAVPWLTLVVCVFLVVKEFIRIYFLKTLYFKQIGTLTELVTYVATLVFMVPFLMEDDIHLEMLQEFKWQAGAIAILFAWVTFLLYLKKIPAIGRYVWMFEEVVKTVLRVLFGLFFLLVAFAFSFFVLLKTGRQFRSYRRALMKTIMWTFGEFEYDTIFLKQTISHRELTLIIFIVFLIVMPILTMNLLVGLAVGDIEEVKQTAFERNFENQVNLLDAFNETYPKWLLRRLYVPYVDDDPNTSTLKEKFVEWFIDLEKDKPDELEMQVISIKNMVARLLMEEEARHLPVNGHSVPV